MTDLSPGTESVDGRNRGVVVRRARTSDVPEIKRLVDTYAGRILLEKNLVTLYEAVQEFWVAEFDGEVVRIVRATAGKKEGRGARLVAHLRGRGDVAMSTDEIMALTRD